MKRVDWNVLIPGAIVACLLVSAVVSQFGGAHVEALLQVVLGWQILTHLEIRELRRSQGPAIARITVRDLRDFGRGAS